MKGIYDLFIDKIQSSFTQIFEKLKTNAKLSNSLFYFHKDFLFVYFSLKTYLDKIEITRVDFIQDLRYSFIAKYETTIKENFSRAFTLIKNVEKNAEMNGKFEKENVVNLQIIDHFVKYIKFMSMSFVDINEEFSESLIQNDEILIEIKNIFSNQLKENYLMLIYQKLDHLFSNLNDINTNNTYSNILYQKFYFLFYILYKMNEVFNSFLNSNIPYLITEEIQSSLEEKISFYIGNFYKAFLSRVSKDVKIFMMNKDLDSL